MKYFGLKKGQGLKNRVSHANQNCCGVSPRLKTLPCHKPYMLHMGPILSYCSIKAVGVFVLKNKNGFMIGNAITGWLILVSFLF